MRWRVDRQHAPWVARLRGPLAPGAQRLLDAALACTAAVVTMALTAASTEEGARAPDAAAYALGAAIGAAHLFRRRHPAGALYACLALLWVYYAAGYPAVPTAPPVCIAIGTVAAAGRLRMATAVVAALVGLEFAWRLAFDREGLVEVAGSSALFDAMLLVAVLVLGDAIHSRRRWAAEAREREQLAEAARERDARRRVEEERLRIARDLHDILGHTLAVVAVHAGVAADVLRDGPPEAREALRTIRAKSREAMAELRATVGVLRDEAADGSPLTPTPSLAGLDELIADAGGAGLDVRVEAHGAERPLPAAVDLTAYRVVQEALTNVLRHAHARSATVALRYEPAAVVVEVDDDGHGPGNGAAVGGGHGLHGMRERVKALDGELEAGPRAGGAAGFRVRARLPTAEA